MPLPERVIEPVSVCRGTLQVPVPDELEGVTNGSLANIIRQLSTLSRHAEEMFGNLFQEAEGLAVRGSNLQARIDKLAVKVTQLDSNIEEVTLHEIQLRKAFRSTQNFDQQVVSRDTMPKSMLEQYLACDRPPPLDKLNPYREDGKDGLKFYTDANYFFDLWRHEMLQSTEKAERGKRGGLKGSSRDQGNRHKKPRRPHNTAERHRQKAALDGEYIMTDGGGGGGGRTVTFDLPETNGYGVPGGYQPEDSRPHRPNSIEIQGGASGWSPSGWLGPAPAHRQPTVRFADEAQPASASSRYTQEPIYTPRILRDVAPSGGESAGPGAGAREGSHSVKFDLSHQYIPNATQQEQPQEQQGASPGGRSVGGTPQRRPTQPPPAPPPETEAVGGTPTRKGLPGPGSGAGRDNLPPPPPPPAQEQQGPAINGQLNADLARVFSSQNKPGSGVTSPSCAPEALPPPPPAPCSPSPPPAPPPPPPPPPPAPPMQDLGTAISHLQLANGGPKTGSPGKKVPTIASPPPLKKPAPLVRNPQEDVRSDLLKAIRDGIALKKVEAKEAQEQGSEGQAPADVATILARRVAVEFSDSDDCPSDSEYDSDDWGETDA